jgi:hypothetical protein
MYMIGQFFTSLREKKSPTEKWTGRARTSREPASRNVRVWPFMRNIYFAKTMDSRNRRRRPKAMLCRFETTTGDD